MKKSVFQIVHSPGITPIPYISIPDTCVAIYRDPSNRVLLVRQFRPIFNQFMLEIPGGSKNDDELPVSAASREFKEETGISILAIEPMISVALSVGASDEIVHIFKVFEIDPGNVEKSEPGIELNWIDHQNALDMIRRGEIVDAKTIIALQLL